MAFELRDLPDRNRRCQHSQERRGQYQTGTSIEQRTAPVNQRTKFGHLEVDTILSSHRQSKACLVTFVECSSRLLWALKARSYGPVFCELYAALWLNCLFLSSLFTLGTGQQ
ncbi:hypothetical protein EQ827_07940 [Lactobacillus bombi]|nr:hypothetical protein [Bombilactobacillus bombi]MBA1435169.1 hypothetical protein [Bombilactobacillus bombi]